jgi:hypothetical protein
MVNEWLQSLGDAYADTAARFSQAHVDGSALHELLIQHERMHRDDSVATSAELRELLPHQVGARLNFFHQLRKLVHQHGEHVNAPSESADLPAVAPSPPAKLVALMTRVHEGLERAKRVKQASTRRDTEARAEVASTTSTTADKSINSSPSPDERSASSAGAGTEEIGAKPKPAQPDANSIWTSPVKVEATPLIASMGMAHE